MLGKRVGRCCACPAARRRSRPPAARGWRARPRRAGASSSTKRSPRASSSSPPSPRTASVTRNPSVSPSSRSAVGWNCMNSMSASAAPASCASCMPAPIAPARVASCAPTARPLRRWRAPWPGRRARPSRSGRRCSGRRAPTARARCCARGTSIRSCASTIDESAAVTWRPVALPPACTTRRRACPPSSESAAPRRPSGRSGCRAPPAPRTRAGDSAQRTRGRRAANGSPSGPEGVLEVQLDGVVGLSAAARPPCAQ